MIKPAISIKGKITTPIKIKGKTNLSVVIIEPELEDLEVIPSLEDQVFKSEKDGYNEVTIKKIETENLDITPEPQEKRFDGVYKEVVIRGDSDLKPENIKKGIKIFNIDGAFDAVDTRDANAMASELLEDKTAYVNNLKIQGTIQTYSGENQGGTEDFQTEEIEVAPSTESQNFEGLFNKVTISGDENLMPNNIRSGVEIFNVVGDFEGESVKITDASGLFYNKARLDILDDMLKMCGKIKAASNMFYSCEDTESLDLTSLDMSECTTTSEMFNWCKGLKDLDMSGCDLGSVQSGSRMFYLCNNLTNFKSFKNYGKGFPKNTSSGDINKTLSFTNSTKLTHESLIDLIDNGLYDLYWTFAIAHGANFTKWQKVTLSTTSYALLTEEEIARAKYKGWTITTS